MGIYGDQVFEREYPKRNIAPFCMIQMFPNQVLAMKSVPAARIYCSGLFGLRVPLPNQNPPRTLILRGHSFRGNIIPEHAVCVRCSGNHVQPISFHMILLVPIRFDWFQLASTASYWLHWIPLILFFLLGLIGAMVNSE